MVWHNSSVEDIQQSLNTDTVRGLTEQEAEKRLEKYGLNKLPQKRKKTFIEKMLAQFKDFMVIILLIAAAVSILTTIIAGEYDWIEPIVIISIVILNAILGVVQESKAEAALEALKNLSAPSAKVIRDGAVKTIKAENVVQGDIIVLEAGDFIPADARLFASASLRCEESALTGESLPVEKDCDSIIAQNAGIGDRLNMVHTGCTVTYGRGRAVVTGTGTDTEMGRIAQILSETEDSDTPLQIKLSHLGKTLGIAVLGLCAIIFVLGMLMADTAVPLADRVLKLFMTTVSLAVSAVPEGLPAIVTIVLAIGVQRMVSKNAIIRRLPAVETLGSASVICSDKTGTLTQNRMTLVKVYDGENIVDLAKGNPGGAEKPIVYGALCSDGNARNENGKLILTGDPTETSIAAALLKYTDLSKDIIDGKYKRVGEIPFDSDRKLMTTINMVDGKPYAVVKGAPDILISRCVNFDSAAALEANSSMAKEALRVLGVAYKPLEEIPEKPEASQIEQGLTFIGLLGMIDPPRQEAAEAVKLCIKAGIRVIMITGDHIETAKAIAKQLKILNSGSGAIEGKDLSKLSDKELYDNIEKYTVYARVSPEDKIRIVQVWQKKGHVVAMTGDGVNDAPALKAADIGCAMGITGTDVAKGAAAMTLTDDNFATIVTAVKEGRGIYDNIKKAVHFLLSCNLGEVAAVFFAILLGWGTPLSPIMLLWINLVTDSLPAIALGMEPIEKDIMDKKPRKKDESIFSGGLGISTVWQGLVIGILTLAAYYIGFTLDGQSYGSTMAFAVLAISQLVHAFNIRSKHSVFSAGLFSNKYMTGAFIISVLIMCAALFTPLHILFGIEILSITEWLTVAVLSIAPLAVCEAVKFIQSLAQKRKISVNQEQGL